MQRTRRIGSVALAAGLVMAAAACSDDEGEKADSAGTTSPQSVVSSSTTTPGPSLPPAPEADASGDQTAPSGTNGIAIGIDGALWIADGVGNQVLHVDPGSGEILQRWPAPEGSWPDDVAIDEAGRVFWTGFESGQVGRIDPETGEHVIVAEVAPRANPITFTQDGRLFVGLAVTADGLYDVDPSGVDEPRLLNPELGNVNGFDVAADGMLYGPRANGEIVRIDWESGTVLDVVADGFGIPSAVKEGPDGALYVLSSTPSPAISRVDIETGEVTEVAALADFPGSLADNFAVRERAVDTTVTTAGEVGSDGTDGDGTGAAGGALTFYVTTFDAPTVLVVNVGPEGVMTSELAIGSPG